MFEIRGLLPSEINLLENLPPKEWNMNLPEIVVLHYGHPYYYPIAALVDNKIVGFGNGILNNKVGWIGNILVTPENRRQGIGHGLTTHLVEYFKSKGCISQLLIASEMGKNIYARIGFQISSTYSVYQLEKEAKNYKPAAGLRKIKNEDYPVIRKLDEKVTGEERYHLVERFFATGFVYESAESKEVHGFYLPDLGNGFIVATSPEAGLELLKYRINEGKTTVTVPSENIHGLEFLEKEGFLFRRILPRMVLGDKLNWKPDFIFNRGSGYFG